MFSIGWQSRSSQSATGHGKCGLLVCVLAACFFTVTNASAQSSRAPTALDRARVEAFTDGLVLSAMRSGHIAGVGVAVVDRTGIVLTKGYGTAAPGRAADSDTLFRVGSISKTGTWIALMQLVEQGKLKLDDPINKHLS